MSAEPLWVLTDGGTRVLRVEDIDPPLTPAELESLRSRGYAFDTERDAVKESCRVLRRQWGAWMSHADLCKKKLEAARARMRGLKPVSRKGAAT